MLLGHTIKLLIILTKYYPDINYILLISKKQQLICKHMKKICNFFLYNYKWQFYGEFSKNKIKSVFILFKKVHT